MSNSRDLGLTSRGSAGKGSAPRHKLNDDWRANYDAIDWGPGETLPVCVECGELVPDVNQDGICEACFADL